MTTCTICGQENPEGFRFCGACGAPLEEAPTREERKVVTVLFADLVGFTSRAEQLDPEDVRATLSPYYARLRTEIERHGGTVEKFIGDAVMALFGAPVAHEDDPERAVRAALAIRDGAAEAADELRLQVRIAVNTGEALIALGARPLEGEGMASGDVINTAARLQTAAPVNGILVGEATYRATRGRIDYREAEPVEAKGKAEPVPVWEALAARSRFGEDLEEQQRTRLVGRDRELGLLVDALARCRRELAPQLVTLVGVPGIGKSRLVSELFQEVDRDPELIWWRQGRSLPYDEGLAYWALGEIVKAQAGILESDPLEATETKLRTLVDEVVPETDDPAWVAQRLRPLLGLSDDSTAGDRSEAFAAWRQFLEALADQRPLVLVFEDLHWADDGLLDFVDHLADWATGVPLLIVGTARPELLDRRPGWGGGKRNATTVSIQALTSEETAELLGDLLEQILLPADLQVRVLALAEGNPLYAVEYVRMLQDRGFLVHEGGSWRLVADRALPLPETVQAMISARLDALSPDEKGLVQDASVIGKVFWPRALVALGSAVPAELLHGLERKEFIRRERRSAVAGEPQYAFLHALVRDVAYGQIPRAARADKHRRLAGWIETLAADRTEDRAEMLAHHYLEAIELARAAGLSTDELREPGVRALLEGCERAVALFAWPRVVELAQTGLELLTAGDPRRARFLLARGRAEHSLGTLDLAVLIEASALFEAEGDLEKAAETELLIQHRFWDMHNKEERERHLARAVALVEGRPLSWTVARVSASNARRAAVAGDAELALELAARALELAEALGDDELMSMNLNTRGLARNNIGDTNGFDDLRRSAELAETAKAPQAIHNAYNNLATQLTRFGRLDEASAALAQAREVDERYGYAAGLRWLEGEHMEERHLRGDWNESLRLAEEIIAASADSPYYHEGIAHRIRSEILLSRDEVELALVDSERALAVGREAGDEQVVVPALVCRARTLAAAGRESEANEVLATLLESHDLVFAGHELPLLLVQLGSGGDYLAAVEDLHATPWIEAARAAASGDLASAAELYGQIGARAAEAEARLFHAEALVHAGRRAEANAELDRCLGYFRSIGAVGLIRRAEKLVTATA
ncbi:MAG TPA: AAA family ATPase [Gaiellaceae bacterium]|nr:AAA family ATPase [Gaiellaceae bacterium]